ncbi:MAG: universal stress protein [Nocardioides sp.]
MTYDPRPVVVAVGAQETPVAALAFAAEEAARLEAPLELVHTYTVMPGPEAVLVDVRPAERVASETLRLAVETAADLVPDSVPVSSHLVEQPVVHALVQAADDARLLVLERRERDLLERLASRSTTSGVAARTSTAVVAVPSGWTPPESGPVVVGVDVPDRSAALLHQAFEAAQERGTWLRIVHTWWFPGGYDDMIMDRVAAADCSDRARAQIEESLAALREDFPHVPVTIDVSHGRPVDALADASATALLVVVGRHDPLVPIGSHLGPVARSVLREASCPVLLAAPHQHRGVRHEPTRRRTVLPV